MKCPVYQHEMTQSQAGWLCLGCGHFEAFRPGAPAWANAMTAGVEAGASEEAGFVDLGADLGAEPEPIQLEVKSVPSRAPFTPRTHPRPVSASLMVTIVLVLAAAGTIFL